MASPFMLIYDIKTNSDCPNPSDVLRPVAFRLNQSCWCIYENDIPFELLAEFNRHGVTWHTLKFDVAENTKLVKLAAAAFREEIQDYITEGNRTVATANRRLGMGDDTPSDSIKRHKTKCIQVARRIGKVFKDLKACAEKWGVEDSAYGLQAATQLVRGMRTSMQERVTAYMDALATIELNPNMMTDPMVKAIRAGQVPMYVVADYMDDYDMDRRKSRKLRTMFD